MPSSYASLVSSDLPISTGVVFVPILRPYLVAHDDPGRLSNRHAATSGAIHTTSSAVTCTPEPGKPWPSPAKG
jgi:hypothetical protein